MVGKSAVEGPQILMAALPALASGFAVAAFVGGQGEFQEGGIPRVLTPLGYVILGMIGAVFAYFPTAIALMLARHFFRWRPPLWFEASLALLIGAVASVVCFPFTLPNGLYDLMLR